MGNTKLVSEVESARGKVTSASSSLTSALSEFSDAARKVEEKLAELEAREARCEARERMVEGRMKEMEGKEKEWKEAEGRMKEAAREFEEKKRQWEEVEARMAANSAKIDHVVTLNVGGKPFSTTKATLLQQKGSYFEEMLLSGHYQQTKNGEYFVDQDPKYFKTVLNYLRNGRLRNDDLESTNLDDLRNEFQFYKLSFPQNLGTAEQKVAVLQTPEHELSRFEGGNLLSQEHQQKISEWLPGKKFVLLYKATRDGFKSSDFHKMCDYKGPTLTIIQSNGGCLFGGFTSESWAGSSYRADPTAFIFTLHNPHNLPPTQYKLKPGDQYGISSHGSVSATFGGGHDIYVSSESHQSNSSCTNFPFSYVDTTGKGDKTFTGAYLFTTKEVEVYAVK